MLNIESLCLYAHLLIADYCYRIIDPVIRPAGEVGGVLNCCKSCALSPYQTLFYDKSLVQFDSVGAKTLACVQLIHHVELVNVALQTHKDVKTLPEFEYFVQHIDFIGE